MNEWSDFDRRHELLSDFSSTPSEIVRNEFSYRGFLLHRTDGHIWRISALDRNDVAGLGGAFTKLDLAQDAIDRFIADKQGDDAERR